MLGSRSIGVNLKIIVAHRERSRDGYARALSSTWRTVRAFSGRNSSTSQFIHWSCALTLPVCAGNRSQICRRRILGFSPIWDIFGTNIWPYWTLFQLFPIRIVDFLGFYLTLKHSQFQEKQRGGVLVRYNFKITLLNHLIVFHMHQRNVQKKSY